jgi:hypothetical protein
MGYGRWRSSSITIQTLPIFIINQTMPVAGGPKITKTGILLEVDAADKLSYPGTGTTWINPVTPGTYNGTLNNISFDSNDSKGALIFTGSNTYVDFGNVGNLSSAWSFQVAFKPAATASGEPYTVLSYASGSDTGSITFKLDYSSSTQEVVLSTFSTASATAKTVHAISASALTGSWNIVHGTFGSSLAALYVNGLGQAYAPTTGSVVGYNASNQLYAGASYGSDTGFYTGSIANISVNNADLDGLSVNKNYNAFASRFGLPVRRPTITDADAFAFVEAAGLADETQILAINSLVLGLKSNNLWTKMQVIYPFIGGTAYSHKWNLKNTNTFTATFIGALEHNSFGVGSGSIANGYISSNFNDLTDFTNISSSVHASAYTTTENGVGGRLQLFWNTRTTAYNEIGLNYQAAPNNLGAFAQAYGDKTGMNASSLGTSLGFNAVTRTGTTQSNFYYKSPTTTLTLSNTGVFQRIANRNPIRFLGGEYGNNGQSAAIGFGSIGEGLSSTDIDNLYTVVQAYQTTLGRNI